MAAPATLVAADLPWVGRWRINLAAVTSRGTKPNGKPLDEMVVLSRVLGGSGLSGKWKTNKVNSSPSLIGSCS